MREEYEGRSIKDFHVDAGVIADILSRLTRGETLNDYPARLRAKDGTIKHVLINSNVRWVDGAFVHTRCFTRDITDRILAEQALEDANRDLEQKVVERTAALERANAELQELVDLRNRFVAMVSHELRTPLTSISGFTATMQRYWKSLPDTSKREFVEIIGTQSERLSRLVDDLLTLSRVASSALRPRVRSMMLRPAIVATIEQLRLGEAVHVDCDPALAACADPDHVQQILVNCLANAVKYGGAPIEVAARADDGWVELRICDRGPGVPADFVPRLFEEFAALERSGDGTDSATGTGLGLAIVRHLAEAQGGTVAYAPNEPSGSVFSIRLPRPEPSLQES